LSIEALNEQQRMAWKDRTLPPVSEVSEGTWAVPIPIPNNPLVYTYCYVLYGNGRLVLIDPGWGGQEQMEALASGLHALGFALNQIDGAICTHYHYDHVGLVADLQRQNPKIWLALHQEDINTVELLRRRDPSVGTDSVGALEVLETYGVPDDRIRELVSVVTARSRSSFDEWEWPGEVIAIEDAARMPVEGRHIQAIWTPGHTYGHTVFVDADGEALFSGDHVLPSITPHVGMDSRTLSHCLSDYLGSLQHMSELTSIKSVLPAHGFSFVGLRERANEIMEHHSSRLAEVEACWGEDDARTVYEVAQGLHWSRGFNSLSGLMLHAALAETAAHMHYLELPVDCAVTSRTR
jgi:glyoxylase-like metal-dependent hydrolase (beta-lactamase superfamily II)